GRRGARAARSAPAARARTTRSRGVRPARRRAAHAPRLPRAAGTIGMGLAIPLPHALNPFWIALSIGLILQAYKGFAFFLREKRWTFQRFVQTGGMPSSHSASVAALSTTVGFNEGFRSTLFGVTLFFSLIVMYDAAGLRRAAGRQAAILNRLIAEHFRSPGRETQRLMELLGQTPLEVAVVAALGAGSALIWHQIYPR